MATLKRRSIDCIGIRPYYSKLSMQITQTSTGVLIQNVVTIGQLLPCVYNMVSAWSQHWKPRGQSLPAYPEPYTNMKGFWSLLPVSLWRLIVWTVDQRGDIHLSCKNSQLSSPNYQL